MKKMLDDFAQELQAALGDRLSAVVLFGSAAKSEDIPVESDVNVLIVLKEVTLDLLSRSENILLQVQKRRNVRPIFWSDAELRGSADVFPIEWLDIRSHYRVLAGRDPLAGMQFDERNLRHQVEFELRSKLLKLRLEWFAVKDSPAHLSDALVRSGRSFAVLFAFAKRLEPGLPDELAEPLRAVERLKKKEIQLNPKELEQLYVAVHRSVGRMAAAIDGGKR